MNNYFTQNRDQCICPWCETPNTILLTDGASEEVCWKCKKPFLCQTEVRYSTCRKDDED
ncbi:MAG: hypothetical protein LBI65_03355 [Candidatus Symbiothrix sp.]|nr:hypothetical protein [Candidatus Symbiothrix sp.]